MLRICKWQANLLAVASEDHPRAEGRNPALPNPALGVPD